MAKLYFRYGAMNSGKSTSLLQAAYNYEERGQHVLLAKPAIDTKGADQIDSRLGVKRTVDFLVRPDDDIRELFAEHRARIKAEASDTLVPESDEHEVDVACLLIDEAQFL
ncbi:MAG TPA: thymidine kinase, partial [Microbacterium sp.]|nr:thymidine kinase [Microbacterium sp.]